MDLRPPILVLALAAFAVPQAPPPDTELFLYELSFADGQPLIGKPLNISNNPGYDNQPSFTPDCRAVLFTSVRGGRTPEVPKGAATGSDIYRYDLASEKSRNSPVSPKGERIVFVGES